MTLGIVILAAGEGTRMRSALPKVLHPICGRPLLGHVLAVADLLASERTVIVLAPNTVDAVRSRLGEDYDYVVQAQRLGTGHAVLQARSILQNQTDQVLVLYGDTPLLRIETAQTLIDAQRSSGALVSLLSFQADPPTGYGRVLRTMAGEVIDLIEERNATPEQRAITEVNSGVMCFDAGWLWEWIEHVPRNPVKGEYYLTDLVPMAVAQRGPGSAVALSALDAREAWGVNDRVQLAQAEAVLRERVITALMRSGVTVIDPATTYIDVEVTVGNDTTLFPGTFLRGRTKIGTACEIGPYTTIIDSTIGDRSRVSYAFIEGTETAPDSKVLPFTRDLAKDQERGIA